MLNNIFTLRKPAKIVGIGHGVVREMGSHPIFGDCHFMPEAPINILSFSRCRQTFHIYYNFDRDFFTLVPLSDDLKKICPPLIFIDDGSDEGIYRYSKNLTANPNLIVLPSRSAVDKYDKDLKLYTPEQFRIARELRKLHKALSHPNDEALSTLLDTGGIMDTQLNRKSVTLSNEILGQCEECLEGKATDSNSIRNHNYESRSFPPDHIGHTVWMDIIFVKGSDGKKIPLLLALEELTNFGLGAKMKDKSAKSLKEAMHKVIGYLKAYQHTVREVHSDSEAVFGACAAFLGHLGIILKQKAPGKHARRVERYVQTLRTKMRAVIKSLPYKLPPKLHVPLVQSTIIGSNLVPNSQTSTVSPATAVTSIKPSFKGSLQYKFGDAVMCFRPNIEKTDKDTMRADRALFLYFNKGQYSADVYLVDRDEFVTRDLNPSKFRTIPFTDDLIQKLNQMSEGSDFLGDNTNEMVHVMPRTLIPRHEIDNEIPQVDDAEIDQNDEVSSEEEAEQEAVDIEQDVQESEINKDFLTEDSPISDFYPESTQESLPSPIFDRTPPAIPTNNPVIPEAGSTINDVPVTGLPESPVPPVVIPDNHPGPSTTPRQNPREPSIPTRAFYPRQSKTKDYKSMANDESRAHAALTAKLQSFDKYTHQIQDDKHLILLLNITVRKAMQEMKEAATTAIESELTSMVSKEVLNPVDYDKLTPAQKKLVLYSHMFLKDKYYPDGEFEKLKARLVGGGNFQDRDLLATDPSSPTVDFLTVQLIMNLTCAQKLKTAVLDIKTAYLNADLDEEVYIAIDPECAKIFVKLYPQYSKYIRHNGTLVCLVQKALYGLVRFNPLIYSINTSEAL